MTVAIRLTDGTTTVYLDGTNSSPWYTQAYTPMNGYINAVYAPRRIGADLISSRIDNVSSEPISLLLKHTGGVSAALAEVQKVNRLLRQTERTADDPRAVAPLYLEVATAGTSGTFWRSRIYSGELVWDQSALDWQYLNNVFKITGSWTRAPYFEGPEKVVPVYNNYTSGSPTTDYLTVDPYTDTNSGTSGRDNWLQMDATAIGGDLPVTPYIELDRTDSQTSSMGTIVVAHGKYLDFSNFRPQIEGESASTMHSGAVVDSGSPLLDRSNNQQLRIYWQPGTTWQRLASWDLSPTLLAACKGQLFDIWVRGGLGGGKQVFYQARIVSDYWNIYTSDSPRRNAFWTGGEYYTEAGSLHRLGTVRLPPSAGMPLAVENMKLELYGRGTGQKSDYTSIDFIFLAPAGSQRRYYPAGNIYTSATFLSTGTLHDRGYANGSYIGGECYVTDSVAGDIFAHRTEGRIELIPGIVQRMWFLYESTIGLTDAPRMRVKIRVRERKATL